MSRTTWLDLADDDPFGVATLPYGVFSDGGAARVGVRIGPWVLDGSAVARAAGRTEVADAWATTSLNAFLALGRPVWDETRAWLTGLLTDETRCAAVEPHLVDLDAVTLHLPVAVGDYVDFYASEHHARNVGSIFRPDGEPLTPNWKHLPIGYHGRAGTIVVSGTDVIRPVGQRRSPGEDPVLGPSTKLDIEAEVAFVVGTGTALGARVGVDDAADHVFGIALFNDWSARDIQAWEYVPLGPFLGKSFASSMGAWVVPMSALEPARVALPDQDPLPLEYLRGAGPLQGLDLRLEVRLNGELVARPPFAAMYWSPAQMLAHLTVNGASIRPGDLFASGTVSGPGDGERGSLLELTWNGTRPMTLGDGTTRTFLEDGDTVTITGWAPGPGGARIGLGEVTGTVRPAR